MKESYIENEKCPLMLCEKEKLQKVTHAGCALVCPLCRENILVLDIFFEALNYEKIEQKKAYEIAGLLGKIFAFHWDKKKKKNLQYQHSADRRQKK